MYIFYFQRISGSTLKFLHGKKSFKFVSNSFYFGADYQNIQCTEIISIGYAQGIYYFLSVAHLSQDSKKEFTDLLCMYLLVYIQVYIMQINNLFSP